MSRAHDFEKRDDGNELVAARDSLDLVDSVGRVLAADRAEDPTSGLGQALEELAEFYGASMTLVVRFEADGAHVVGIWVGGRYEKDPQIRVESALLEFDETWRTDRRTKILAPADFGAEFAALLEAIGPGQKLLVAPIVDCDVVEGAVVVLAPGVHTVDDRQKTALQLCGEVLWRHVRNHEIRQELQERAEVAEILAREGVRLHEVGLSEAKASAEDVLGVVGAYVGADVFAVHEIAGAGLLTVAEWTASGRPASSAPDIASVDVAAFAGIELESFDELSPSALPSLADGMFSGLIVGGRVDGDLIGIFFIGRADNRPLRPAQIELVVGTAQLFLRLRSRMLAKIALLRRGVVENARTEIAEMLVNSSPSMIDTTVTEAFARLGDVFDVRRVHWIELEEDGDSAALALQWNDGTRPETPTAWTLDGELGRLRGSLRAPMVLQPEKVAELCDRETLSPTLVVPVVVEDDVAAVLTLTGNHVAGMPDDERRALTDVAGVILQARHRARRAVEAEYRQRLDDVQLKIATRFLDREVTESGPVLDWVLGELGRVLEADIIALMGYVGTTDGELHWWTKDDRAAEVAQLVGNPDFGLSTHFESVLDSGEPQVTRSRRLSEAVRRQTEERAGSEYSMLTIPLRAPGMALLLGVCMLADREWSAAEQASLRQVVGQVRQFIDVVASRQRLEYDATHDSLTGLANRRRLIERFRDVLEGGRSGAVMMIDIDRFKVVNDSLGHTAGDQVLIAIAERVRTCVRDGDLVSRFGGDEFAVLITEPDSQLELAAAADRLISVIREPVMVHGTTVIPTCSVGIAISNPDDEIEMVIAHADAALYDAKAKGRDRYEFFDEAHRRSLRERLHLETALRRGLLNDEFVPWFQPEYDLDRGEIIGVEALVRWAHPREGVLDAYRFIDTAEEIGLAPEMSRLVLEQSLATLQRWLADGFRTRMRVNVAAAQLQSRALVDQISEGLDRFSIPADMLCVEITERSLMLDLHTAIDVLGQVRDLGVEVAVDDFGTGFSSLARLKDLPVDTLKIDRSFVDGIVTDVTDREIVRTIIWLSRGLGLDVVAEGVEHPEQAEMLVELGCTRAQGWLWSPAVPAEQVPQLSQMRTRSPQRR